MIILSIDGASRRNGKPDCLSAGVAFIKRGEETKLVFSAEKGSTNQRGELQALAVGLSYVSDMLRENPDENEVYLITDSEYIFNTLFKGWIGNWQNKGWTTSSGEPVKNKDIWEHVADKLAEFEQNGWEILPFHVKGHLFSIGKVTSKDLITRDSTGEFLYRTIRQKVVQEWPDKEAKIRDAVELFQRNVGYEPPINSFASMIICNIVADAAATYWADKTDSEWTR